MKRKRHTEEQIISILKETEFGLTTADLLRKHGISEQTFYLWNSKNAQHVIVERWTGQWLSQLA